MMTRERLALAVGLFVLAVAGAFVALRFEVTTDVMAFLPEGTDPRLGELSRRVADSELSRTMVLTIGAPDEDVAIAASQAFEAALRDDARVRGAVAFLEGGPPEGLEQAIWELYHPRRWGFVATTPDGARARVTDGKLREAAVALRERLARPLSPLLSRVAPGDPLLVLPGLFERLERSRASDLRLSGGRFLTNDGRHAVLFLGTNASAFDSTAQRPLLDGIADAFAEIDARFDGVLELDQSGVNRFAVRAEDAIKGDIQRVSTLSLVGIAALLWLLFRSFRLVALTSIPLGAGMLVASAAVLAVFGRLHGITLAFGASLLGVASDYVVHLYCHQAVSPHPDGPKATLATIWPSLFTGAATTVLGFAALGGAGLAGLQEVALFSSVGVLTALVVTKFLPPLLPASSRPVRFRARMVSALDASLAWLRRRRRLLFVVPAIALGIVAVGLPRARYNDDFASLGRLDPGLLEEDERVRARVTRHEQMRFVVALGPTDEAALVANDAVADALAAAVEAGELGAHRGIGELLPSASRQRGVAEAVRQAPRLFERTTAAFAAEGFRPEAFEPFRAALAEPPAEPLTYAELAASPLAPLVRPFRLELGDSVGFVTFLHGVDDPEALAARIEAIDGAIFLRQADLLGAANRSYQERALRLVALGLLGVLVLLAFRYRDARRTLAVFLPPVLAAAVTVSVLALAGIGLDLVTLTALLLVVSMGEDYGVFLVDADGTDPAHLSASLLSVVLACLTTVLGFGLLALSEHPVLFSIGLSAGVGMIASLLLAPTALVLLGPKRTPSEEEKAT